MKKYNKFMEEISSTELFDGLLGCGLFPDKIPNFLTSEDFKNYIKTKPLPLTTIKEKDYIRYSSMRNINVPRHLGIPEPFAYTNLCYSLSSNWDTIKSHFSDKTIIDEFKISRIHLRKITDTKKLFEMNYKNYIDDKTPDEDLLIGSKYIASADISTCFSSIYSHSISWALVTKNVAKANSGNKTLWYNQLDFSIRNTKYGETNGLLIGPHSSNLISEIILVSIDKNMTEQGFKYIRNIDDYTCYVKSYEEAERFFLFLSKELKQYELCLNNKKSKILPLPQASVKKWVTKLNHFNFVNSYRVNDKQGIRVKELKGFLDYSIELMLDNDNDAAILNYAIKIISKKHLSENAKTYYIKTIHHLLLLYPYLVSLLEVNVIDQFAIGKDKIKIIAEDLYKYGLNSNLYEACSYALYWALKYDFILDIDNLKEKSIESFDCIFMLIAFMYDKKHQKKAYLSEYKDTAKTLKSNDFDRYWLYIYEVLSVNDLSGEYKTLKKAGISFVKDNFR